jgi:biopolymer transport protein ExbB/biopolymer transport protein TolQ
MEINLWELWGHMGLPVKGVVIALSIQAIMCVAVVVDRVLLLTQSEKSARQLAQLIQPAMEARNFHQVLANISELPSNHFGQFLDTGLRSFLTRMQAGDGGALSAEVARRALERKGEKMSRDLNRGMNVLASTGSTAPFVGLLGTVLGIIHAFKLIAESGSGGIGTIGSAIGEALIVTGYGLVVAIPSVLIFNWLSGKIAAYESGLVNSGGELIDNLEIEARTQANAQVAAATQAVVSQAPASYPAPAAAPVSSDRPAPRPGLPSRPVPRPSPVR